MPRTETNTRTLYQFDELPTDRAKERAREWWLRGMDETDMDFVISDADTIADILGIAISRRAVKLYGGGTRFEPEISWDLGNGGGVGFDASYSYARGSARKIREHAPQDKELHSIADALQRAQRRHFYQLTAAVRAHGRDGLSMDFEVDSATERGTDKETAVAVAEALRDFAHWVHSALQREYDYRMSDECVDNDIRANEYEFTEDGERA